MVTAGVYLLLRASPLLEYSSTGLMIITIIGSITAFFGATTALVQNDIKRLIAYSTCSQLGYLFIAVGCSNYSTSIFHLVNHAFFKALLFLSAGSILHALNDEQDMRKMGGLINLLPFTYTNILVGSLSLMALPFLTGYYSKDIIIETAFGQFIFIGILAYWLATVTAILTAVYSFRIIYLTFLDKPKGSRIFYELSLHENAFFSIYPLLPLAFSSIIFGYLFKDLFIGIGTSFWGNSLFIHPNHMSFIESEFHSFNLIKLAPIIGSIFGVFIAYIIPKPKGLQLMPSIIKLYIYKPFIMLHNRYWFDNIYNGIFLYPILYSGYLSSKIIDRGIIEFLGPYGISNSVKFYSKIISKLDTGYIPYYALIFIISLISLILISEIKIILLFCLLLILLF
jgi:NADH-ubiquinone oxidoreductase chain 5